MYMNITYLNLMLDVPLITFPTPVCLLADDLSITRNQEQAEDLWLPTYIDRWV